MEKKDLKVGQIVYGVPVGNAARRLDKDSIKPEPYTITKVGNKYFYVQKEGWNTEERISYYSMDNSGTNSATLQVYLSEEDYYKKVGAQLKIDQISRALSIGGDPISKLQEIYSIVTT